MNGPLMFGLAASRGQRHRFKHLAVPLDVSDVAAGEMGAVQSFLQQYFQVAEINICWGTTQQFVAESREQREVTGR